MDNLEEFAARGMAAQTAVDKTIEDTPSHTCPHCGRKSYNPHDLKYHYCANCRHYCDDVSPR